MGEHAVFLIQPTEKSCISLSQNIYIEPSLHSVCLYIIHKGTSLYTGVYHRAVGFDLLSCYNTKINTGDLGFENTHLQLEPCSGMNLH